MSEVREQETQGEVTDPELAAMHDMAQALLRCPPEARGRALRWLNAWAAEHMPVENVANMGVRRG